MNWLQSLATGYLRAKGCFVYLAGTPDPQASATMAAALRERGFRLFAPGVDLPAPAITLADARAVFEAQHYTVLEPGQEPDITLNQACRVVKAADLVILHPEQPPALGWWDAKPPAKSDDPVHPSRDVLNVLDGIVSYVKAGSPQVHTCKIGGFHKWRRDAHATHRPAAPEPVLPPVPEDAA